MKNFEIFPGIEASIYGALHMRKIRAMVIADLHLGFEGIMAEKGIFIPKFQFEEIMKRLEREKEEEILIILGDLKHEFSSTTYHEFSEVREFFSWAKENFSKVYLVRGNHDNFIAPLCRKFGVEFLEELSLSNFFFIHGHKDKELPYGYIILAHEHPAIELYNKILREKIKCFLYGKIGKRKFVVLPSYSILMQGTEINLIPRKELLSPILRKIDINSLFCLGIDEEVGFLNFPQLGKLRI